MTPLPTIYSKTNLFKNSKIKKEQLLHNNKLQYQTRISFIYYPHTNVFSAVTNITLLSFKNPAQLTHPPFEHNFLELTTNDQLLVFLNSLTKPA